MKIPTDNKDDEDSSSVPSVSPGTSKTSTESQKTIRYNPSSHVMLLREVLALNPFEDATQWDEVASNFNKSLRSTRPNVLAVNTRSVKERVEKLLKAFRTEQMEIVSLKEEALRKATEAKAPTEEDVYCNSPWEGCPPKENCNDETTPKKVKKSGTLDGYVNMKTSELELRREELEIKKQQFELERQERRQRMENEAQDKAAMLSMMKTIMDGLKK
ncbi:uncharacterized protein LOC135499341 [Lineus longissimus]|uniref:uncharacterized protein LOC135499341 n=1 Tax=Lineus longissimus TaxID=88925 RepID=UPI00315DDF2F